MTRALVIGALGQDGSYLIEHLLSLGYEVHGMSRVSHIRVGQQWNPLKGSITSRVDLRVALTQSEPDEIYNVAAVTSPGATWADHHGAQMAEVNAIGVLNLLSVMREIAPDARLVQASSSAIYDPYRYGLYGASKVLAYDAVWGHRTEQGMHVSSAVLYSHTSVRQSRDFLARKIATGVAMIALGKLDRLKLDNLDAMRDWGWASDYARAMIAMGQREAPGDCVVRTGLPCSVGTLVKVALLAAGLEIDVERYVQLPEDCEPCRKPAPEINPPDSMQVPAGWTPTCSIGALMGAMVEHEMKAWGPSS